MQYEAITTASYLVCTHGGLIYPVSSGQLDYSNYVAPFQNYPFFTDENKPAGSDFSEEEELAAFERWCEDDGRDICPYYSGTKEYTAWYQDKISGLKDNNASDEKIKAAYEECLDNAYWYGLDRMNPDARAAVEEIRDNYRKESFLNEEEKAAIQNKYSKDRLELSAQLNQALLTGENTIVTAAAREMREFHEEKDIIYSHFTQEIERYDGYLDDKRKKQVQEIKELFGKGAS